MYLRFRMLKDFVNKFEIVLVKGKICYDCIEYIKNLWIGIVVFLNIWFIKDDVKYSIK